MGRHEGSDLADRVAVEAEPGRGPWERARGARCRVRRGRRRRGTRCSPGGRPARARTGGGGAPRRRPAARAGRCRTGRAATGRRRRARTSRSASWRWHSATSAGDRSGQNGSPIPRRRVDGWSATKLRQAGMIRAGFSPTAVTSDQLHRARSRSTWRRSASSRARADHDEHGLRRVLPGLDEREHGREELVVVAVEQRFVAEAGRRLPAIERRCAGPRPFRWCRRTQ